MPFTVITLKSVPPSLKGDLTRWMQEIDTGVYVGNFNTRIRDYILKKRINNKQNWEKVSVKRIRCIRQEKKRRQVQVVRVIICHLIPHRRVKVM